MMDNVVIKVENLSKQYIINHEKMDANDNFREIIIASTKKIITSLNPFSKVSTESNVTKEEFLALNNINFEINEGERIGIIGKNGAGKSTLLKILSRITEPTTGKIHINGRIASLLEVGTGFHPELTGRENIYLNGAILGMSRAEIRAKFDEIVAFAEVEKFLDTPVKRYSSGMYVRLAFAVAAHLEPDILIVDEVLAVGDVEFQKKCMGKMGEVGQNGRTVIFVSHNMNAIEQLCNKGLLVKEGHATFFDNISDAVQAYLNDIYVHEYTDLNIHRKIKFLSRIAEFSRVYFPNQKNLFLSSENIIFAAEILAYQSINNLRISLTVFSNNGEAIGSTFSDCIISLNHNETKLINVSLKQSRLAPGKYYFGIAIGTGTNKNGHIDYDILLDILHFEIIQEYTEEKVVYAWPSNWGHIMFNTLELNQ